MAVDQLAVNLGVGLPIVIYCLILSAIAVKVDENERDDEEADAALNDYDKRDSKAYKYKRLFFFTFIAYEFFQLSSFGFSYSIPWSIDILPQAMQSITLIPKGAVFIVFFWLAVVAQAIFVLLNFSLNMPFFRKHLLLVKKLFLRVILKNSVSIPHPSAVANFISKHIPTLYNHREQIRTHGATIMLEMLFLPTMRLCWELLSCTDTPTGFYLTNYPELVCWTAVHSVHMFFSFLLMITLFPVCLIHALSKNENDPDFRFLPLFNIAIITVKLLLVAVTVICTSVLATAIIIAVMLTALYASNIIIQPCLAQGSIVNHIRSATFAGASWSCISAVFVIIINDHSDWLLVVIYFIILVVVMVVNFFLSKVRGRHIGRKTLTSLLEHNSNSSKKLTGSGAGTNAGDANPSANAKRLKKTAKNIAKMTLLGKKRVEIIDAGGVATLLVWARTTNSNSSSVQLDALGAIRNLALTNTNIPVLIEHDTVSVLVEILNSKPSDNVCVEIFRILANLADSEAHREQIANSGAIPHLVAALIPPPPSPSPSRSSSPTPSRYPLTAVPPGLDLLPPPNPTPGVISSIGGEEGAGVGTGGATGKPQDLQKATVRAIKNLSITVSNKGKLITAGAGGKMAGLGSALKWNLSAYDVESDEISFRESILRTIYSLARFEERRDELIINGNFVESFGSMVQKIIDELVTPEIPKEANQKLTSMLKSSLEIMCLLCKRVPRRLRNTMSDMWNPKLTKCKEIPDFESEQLLDKTILRLRVRSKTADTTPDSSQEGSVTFSLQDKRVSALARERENTPDTDDFDDNETVLDDEEEFEVDEIQKKRLNNLMKKGEINDKSIGTNGELNKTDPNKGNGFAQLQASPYSSPSQKDTPSNKRKKQSPYVNPQEKTVKSPPNVQQRSTVLVLSEPGTTFTLSPQNLSSSSLLQSLPSSPTSSLPPTALSPIAQHPRLKGLTGRVPSVPHLDVEEKTRNALPGAVPPSSTQPLPSCKTQRAPISNLSNNASSTLNSTIDLMSHPPSPTSSLTRLPALELKSLIDDSSKMKRNSKSMLQVDSTRSSSSVGSTRSVSSSNFNSGTSSFNSGASNNSTDESGTASARSNSYSAAYSETSKSEKPLKKKSNLKHSFVNPSKSKNDETNTPKKKKSSLTKVTKT